MFISLVILILSGEKCVAVTNKKNGCKQNLSLNGCEYPGIYHVGVCTCTRKYYPHVLNYRISGGSAFMCNGTFM